MSIIRNKMILLLKFNIYYQKLVNSSTSYQIYNILPNWT